MPTAAQLRRQITQDNDPDEATELIDLDIDRVDAVESPAHGRGFIIMKQAHPDNANDKHLGRSKDEANPLLGLDPQVTKAFELLLSEIRKLAADVSELKAADRKHANSLLTKTAPAKPATPKSKQPPGGDDDIVVSKSAVEGKKRVSFRNIIYAEPQS